jgi:hypothetical protein
MCSSGGAARANEASSFSSREAGGSSPANPDLDDAEIAVLEEIADQPARARGDDDRVRLGQGLQTGGKVWRFADDGLLPRRACADQIADDHQSGCDPDTRLEFDGFDVEATDSVDGAQPPPAPPARRRPHALAGSRNKLRHRRPCTGKRSHQTRRPPLRRICDSSRLRRVSPPDRAAKPVASNRRGRRTSL